MVKGLLAVEGLDLHCVTGEDLLINKSGGMLSSANGD
jgi:hypothetical protein